MASKIRVGIVGATVTPGGSGWGARAHVPALHALPEFELKAVCTAHEETAKASKEEFGAELGFNNFEAMVSHPDIDLIAVVVRVPGHYDLVMAALELEGRLLRMAAGRKPRSGRGNGQAGKREQVAHGGGPAGAERPSLYVCSRARPGRLRRRSGFGQVQRGRRGDDSKG